MNLNKVAIFRLLFCQNLAAIFRPLSFKEIEITKGGQTLISNCSNFAFTFSVLSNYFCWMLVHLIIYACPLLRVTDSKYRESLDRFEKSKTLKLCLKNAFREFSSKILFRFSKNLTSSRNSQKTKIHRFTSLNMQKVSGKLTKFLVFALKQFKILEHGINLAQTFHLSSI